MAIYAENKSTSRVPVEPGTYNARCYQMIHIGTIDDPFNEGKKVNKVRLAWELSDELQDISGKQMPVTISHEFTLSMHKKSSLRAFLTAWRGKAFSDEEAEKFDVTKLLGKLCMLNLIHNDKGYEKIASVSPPMKGAAKPKEYYSLQELNYDQFDERLFNELPEFVKQKIENSDEYLAMKDKLSAGLSSGVDSTQDDDSDLPF